MAKPTDQPVVTDAGCSLQHVTVSQPQVRPGSSATLFLKASKEACATGKPWAGVTIVSDTPSALTVVSATPTPVQGDDLQVGVEVKALADSESTAANLLVMRQAGTPPAPVIAAMVPISLVATKGPGPIPPGMKPSLDIMWKVLPRDSVADNYGSRVADRYFAIEAVLGNQTAYDLQIAALGFKMPHAFCTTTVLTSHDKQNAAWDTCADDMLKDTTKDVYTSQGETVTRTTDFKEKELATENRAAKPERWVTTTERKKQIGNKTVTEVEQVTGAEDSQISIISDRPENEPPVPVDAYPIVRGTIIHEQSTGRRTLVVNLVKGTSSVLVGVGGFFADSGAFVRAVGISAGPFEKAIELIYPDLSTEHLLNLDNHTLRDGAVLPNNQSVRINAFISRDLVQCPPPDQWYRFGFRSKRNYECLSGDPRMPWEHNFDPSEVMARLGELTLIGNQIQYIGRVRVLTKSTDDTQSKPGPVVSPQTLVANQSDNAVLLTIVGSNLQGATVSLAVGSGISIDTSSVAVSATGNSVSFKVTVAPDAPLGSAAMLQVATPVGTALVPIQITKQVTP